MAICLYGATGYTGKLVTDELVRRGADFVLGGRSREKLEQLSEERGEGAPVRIASVDDPRSLRALLEGCEVLINCAGPFTLAGEPVVAAAVETGTHYVDSTGEQPFMKMVFDRYGEKAERKGVALVPALGFDYVPGDCIARLAAEGHEPLDELVVAYAVSGFGASIGTLRSTLEILKGGDVVYSDGGWRPAPGGIFRASFDFPEPIGRQVMSRYPSGEVITVPLHTDTRKVTSMLSAGGIAPHPILAPVVPFMMPGLAMALRTPLRGLISKAVGRLPAGPDEQDRKAARFTIVAQAKGADGSSGSGTVRGSDPYGLTAVTLVYGAERMADHGYDRAGALAPAAAYDPTAFLNYLGDHGVSWELDRGAPERPRAAARTA
jgi:short subunit dehydrogenase-like uncharacterized protein